MIDFLFVLCYNFVNLRGNTMNNFKIYFGFINRYGEKFDNIRNIAFKIEQSYDFGTLKDETMRSMATFF